MLTAQASQKLLFQVLDQICSAEEKAAAELPVYECWKGSCEGFSTVQAYYLATGRKDEFATLMKALTQYEMLPEAQKPQVKQQALLVAGEMQKIQKAVHAPAEVTQAAASILPDYPFREVPLAGFLAENTFLPDILTVAFKEPGFIRFNAYGHTVIIQKAFIEGKEAFILLDPNICLKDNYEPLSFDSIEALSSTLISKHFSFAGSTLWDIELSALTPQPEADCLLKELEPFFAPIGAYTSRGKNSLHAACANSNPAFVEYFLHQQDTSLSWIPFSASWTDPKWFIHHPDEHGETPLFCAAKRSNAAIIRMLLEHGAQHTPNKKGRTPLEIASICNNLIGVKVLVEALKGSLKENGNLAMFMGAQVGNPEMIEFLVTHGGEVNAVVGDGTPLAIACYQGHARAVEVLLRCGADHHQRCLDLTPIEIAIGRGHKEVIKALELYDANLSDFTHTTLVESAPRNITGADPITEGFSPS